MLNIYKNIKSLALCVMFKCRNKTCPEAFKNLLFWKPKAEYQLKRNCTLLEPFSKTKFNQLYTNYSGSYLWNRIMPRQNTNLEQSATLKVFIENFENYPFIPDNVTRSFCFVLYYEDHNLTINWLLKNKDF